MKNLKMYSISLLALFALAAIDTNANEFGVSETKLSEIESRVNAMGYDGLVATRTSLIAERNNLMALQDNTQSPSQIKAYNGRINEVMVELSAIQKALIAIVGAAAVSNLTDDGYDRSIPPVITIIGANPVTVELGSTYSDAGATSVSSRGTSVSVSTSSNVDTSTVGSYTVTYSATDLNGNTTSATRAVNVEDTTAPVITVTGDNPASAELGVAYSDAGATATDASGSVDVVSSGTVDTDTLGTYTITYTSTDASGNVGTASRTVTVSDTTVPVFTSSATFVVDEGTTAIGTVTATDLQAVTFTISGNDNMAITSGGVLTFITPADYESQSERPQDLPYDGSSYDVTATVTATDASDNAATQVITVSINDVGGLDDDPDTGTGTATASTGFNTGENTGENTGANTGENTGANTGENTGANTGENTGANTGENTGANTGEN
ncbi:MAG: hypothetical protein CMG00_09570, partial [Candidatus Marinimicrobia bacterium]|nr:hypothetical protein [Candidatus Neomarinimicrobiota bacterium]